MIYSNDSARLYTLGKDLVQMVERLESFSLVSSYEVISRIHQSCACSPKAGCVYSLVCIMSIALVDA